MKLNDLIPFLIFAIGMTCAALYDMYLSLFKKDKYSKLKKELYNK